MQEGERSVILKNVGRCIIGPQFSGRSVNQIRTILNYLVENDSQLPLSHGSKLVRNDCQQGCDDL